MKSVWLSKSCQRDLQGVETNVEILEEHSYRLTKKDGGNSARKAKSNQKRSTNILSTYLRDYCLTEKPFCALRKVARHFSMCFGKLHIFMGEMVRFCQLKA